MVGTKYVETNEQSLSRAHQTHVKTHAFFLEPARKLSIQQDAECQKANRSEYETMRLSH